MTTAAQRCRAIPWRRPVRLMRQAADGDWEPVIARVVTAVEAHAAAMP